MKIASVVKLYPKKKKILVPLIAALVCLAEMEFLGTRS
ncbi:unnamed protein product [Brassica oleracea var. botrytis]|uniref:Uncharacterized protein n=1 Tax=Brassica oleracea TaxID=3712 RepID=A0A3P6DVC6_BRAOL|nr:unnamed protein product [Brassica oleracea]